MMRKRMLAVMVLAVMLCCTAGQALAAQTGTVYGGWLVLRETPSLQGRALASYPTGTIVTVTSQTGSWYAVIAPDGLQGYMLGKYLIVSGGGGGGTLPLNSTAYVTSTNGLPVRMRSGPGLGYSVLASYAPGTACTILTYESGWYRIQVGSFTGYMMAKYLTGSKGSSSGSSTKPGTPVTGDVWVTSANGLGVYLRSGAGKNYEAIGFYAVGTKATVVTPGSAWSYIQIGTRTGYMMTQFLTKTKPVKPASGSYVISGNGRNVNLRSGPGTQFAAVAAFPPGTPLTIITQGITWDYIQIQGLYGYMMRVFVCENGAAPSNYSNAM